ncbi:hypothetical protein ACQP2E_12385 [Actinoplanes sp. CA-015351]|uniref:hypothetical protein n=1 Tax=Actinoplanes sp. CA-015351 TaxID=3239897 RepID=UPI003D962F7C
MTNPDDAERPAATNGPPEPAPQPVITLCGTGSCPTVYSTGGDNVLVQGYAATGVAVPEGELLVEIPRELLIEAARRLQEQND